MRFPFKSVILNRFSAAPPGFRFGGNTFGGRPRGGSGGGGWSPPDAGEFSKSFKEFLQIIILLINSLKIFENSPTSGEFAK